MACLEAGETLESAVQEANRAVLEAAGARPNQEGMGTTLVALLRAEDEYSIVNVGDSRAYRVDSGGIRQITDDHSFVAEAVRDGRMSKEEAERSPWASAVTRNLGAGGELVVDSFGPYSAREEHVVILCSDGLHGPVADAELEALVRDAGDIRDIAREAGERALRSGGEDNVSVVALSFGATSGIPTASAARA